MTTSTAETGVTAAAPKAAETKDSATPMFLFALVLVVVVGLATFIWGLVALILSGVVATWAILAFLVLMTAGS
jgi:hypothetical protein